MQTGVFYEVSDAYAPCIAKRPGKHSLMEPNPDNGRIYVMGGSFGVPDNVNYACPTTHFAGTESFRNNPYSLDAAAYFTGGGHPRVEDRVSALRTRSDRPSLSIPWSPAPRPTPPASISTG